MKTLAAANYKANGETQKHSLGATTMNLGIFGVYFALAVIYFWFGGMKFTNYEAQGLVPLVGNSP
ncbi:DUF417 family protein, partial [Pseudomonas agarici]